MIKNKKNTKWTLSADVGEGYDDALIMPYLDCAYIACAAHAGDENIICETLKLAKKHVVNVGAHPGYPDKTHFGRHSLNLSTDKLTATLTTQINSLIDLASKYALAVKYVKPHGALNHDILQKLDILSVICQVVASINPNMALMMPTNANQAQQQSITEQHGLNIYWEVFADRAYEPSGLLRSRQFADALHAEPQTITEQLNRIQQDGQIIAIDGSILDISVAQSICIHGDHAPSVIAIQSWNQPL